MNRAYHHALADVRGRWWRGILAILALVVAFLALNLGLSMVAVLVDVLLGVTDPSDLMAGAFAITPAVMLANNLSLAALVPVSMLLQWGVLGVRPGRLSSVAGRFRWRLLGRLAAVIVPLWIVYLGLTVLVPLLLWGPEAAGLGGSASLDGAALAMLLVVLLTTPLQAAGEEYGARGLVNRATASWVPSPVLAFVVGALASSALFAVAHGASDPWLIAYYLCFGAAMCLGAWGTGGLEGPVLVHVVNNVLLLVPVALTGATDQVFEREAGVGGPEMLIPCAVVLLAAVVMTVVARRSGAQRAEPGPSAPTTGA